MTAIRDLLVAIPSVKRQVFCERLAYDLTIANRGDLVGRGLTSAEMLNGLKWSNELLHRLWGIIWQLRRGEHEAFDRLFDHFSFYLRESPELGRVLPGTLKVTLKYARD